MKVSYVFFLLCYGTFCFGDEKYFLIEDDEIPAELVCLAKMMIRHENKIITKDEEVSPERAIEAQDRDTQILQVYELALSVLEKIPSEKSTIYYRELKTLYSDYKKAGFGSSEGWENVAKIFNSKIPEQDK